MIRTIAFLATTVFALVYGFILKGEGDVLCLVAFGISLLSAFAAFFSYESFMIKKGFWKVA